MNYANIIQKLIVYRVVIGPEMAKEQACHHLPCPMHLSLFDFEDMHNAIQCVGRTDSCTSTLLDLCK